MDQEVKRTPFARHFNGCQVCSIGVGITGSDPDVHELFEVAILPLDSWFAPRKDVVPLVLKLRPDFPHLVNKRYFSRAGTTLEDAIIQGFDREDAVKYFLDWKDRLGLGTAAGIPKPIIPLGHGYARVGYPFMRKWLTDEFYNMCFSHRIRDPEIIGNYLADWADLHSELIPFNRTELGPMCRNTGVNFITETRTPLTVAAAQAELWARLLKRPILL